MHLFRGDSKLFHRDRLERPGSHGDGSYWPQQNTPRQHARRLQPHRLFDAEAALVMHDRTETRDPRAKYRVNRAPIVSQQEVGLVQPNHLPELTNVENQSPLCR